MVNLFCGIPYIYYLYTIIHWILQWKYINRGLLVPKQSALIRIAKHLLNYQEDELIN